MEGKKKRDRIQEFSWIRPKNRRYSLRMLEKKTSVLPDAAIQLTLRPALIPISGNRDYVQFRKQLEIVHQLLFKAGIEDLAIRFGLENLMKKNPDADQHARNRQAKNALKALRTNVLRLFLKNPPFRDFSISIYSSELLADFCRAVEIDKTVKGLSKSAINRMSLLFTEKQLRTIHEQITRILTDSESCLQIGLQHPIDSTLMFIDSTCLEANIHYPVDWVLLKDVSQTLLKAIRLIRKTGLLCRMPQGPKKLVSEMNRLCIKMTHSGWRKESKRYRKQVFRQMRTLLRRIGEHAKRHRDMLDNLWSRTDYSKIQANHIIARIDEKVAQIPLVVQQAHERIIRGKQVPSSKKILSIHDPDINVIVRGKTGRKTEFGNTLMIAESMHGYLIDWKLYRKQAPSESVQLAESIQRQEDMKMRKPIMSICTDRGFNSKKLSRQLRKKGIYDATCPRDPKELQRRMKEDVFSDFQKRRGSTEARIAILNQMMNTRLRAKGFENRVRSVGWTIISHNL